MKNTKKRAKIVASGNCKEAILAIKALETARMCVEMSLKIEMNIHKIVKKHYEPLGLKVSPFYESLDILLLGNEKIKELNFSYAIGKNTKKALYELEHGDIDNERMTILTLRIKENKDYMLRLNLYFATIYDFHYAATQNFLNEIEAIYTT